MILIGTKITKKFKQDSMMQCNFSDLCKLLKFAVHLLIWFFHSFKSLKICRRATCTNKRSQ